MKLINELLHYPDFIPEKQVFMFTGNRVIGQHGLIMGGGNALACREAYPQLPRRIAKMKGVKDASNLFLDQDDGLVGCMFTKDHYKDPSNLDSVIEAINDLKEIAEGKGKAFTFHLPYPAIGLGGIYREQLEPTMETLPDNVIVYVV